MYDMLQRAFEAAGLPWRELHKEDRGDGTLIVIPPGTPATVVAAHALGHLATALRQYNQSASDALRMQLRVALHAGPVICDAQGVTSNAINQTARLVQARILRKHLNETQADLGVIVSAYIYDNVIGQHGSVPIGAADYRKIRFQVKESALIAWIRLTGTLANDQAEGVSSRIAVDPPGHRLAIGAGPGREVLAGGRGARRDHPGMRDHQVRDQDVEVDPGRVLGQGVAVPWKESRWPCGGGSSVTQPGYHSTGVPPSSPAQNRASAHGSSASSTTSLIQPMAGSLAPLTRPGRS
jgi:hypothetical protein